MLTVESTINTNSASSSALSVAGGAWIVKNLYVGGATVFASTSQIRSDAESTSTSTGALTVTGGVGIGKNVQVGGYLGVLGNAVITGSAGNTLEVNGQTKLYNTLEVSGKTTLADVDIPDGNLNIFDGNTLYVDTIESFNAGTVTFNNGIDIPNGDLAVYDGNKLLVDTIESFDAGTVTFNDGISVGNGPTILQIDTNKSTNKISMQKNNAVITTISDLNLRMSSSDGWNDTSITRNIGLYNVSTYLQGNTSYPLSGLEMTANTLHTEDGGGGTSNLYTGVTSLISNLRNAQGTLVGSTAIRVGKLFSIYDDTFSDLSAPSFESAQNIGISLDAYTYDPSVDYPKIQMNFIDGNDDENTAGYCIAFEPRAIYFDSVLSGLVLGNNATYIMNKGNLGVGDASAGLAIKKYSVPMSSSNSVTIVTVPSNSRGIIMGKCTGYNANKSGFIAAFSAGDSSTSVVKMLAQNTASPLGITLTIYGNIISGIAGTAFVDNSWNFIIWYSAT